MSGRASKERGRNYENEFKDKMLAFGYHAERVYGSGAIGTKLGRETQQNLDGDVFIRIPPDAFNTVAKELNNRRRRKQPLELEIEVKYRSKDFPDWLKRLESPVRTERMGFIPGYDILRAILHDFSKDNFIKQADARYWNYLKKSSVLALRFPKPSHSATGWVIAVPL